VVGLGVGKCGFGRRWRGTVNCSTWNNLKSAAMTQVFAAFLRSRTRWEGVFLRCREQYFTVKFLPLRSGVKSWILVY